MKELSSRVLSLEETIKSSHQYPFVQINDRREYDGYMVVTMNNDQRIAQNKIISDHIINAGLVAIWDKKTTKVAAIVLTVATVGGFVLELIRLVHS